MKNGRQDPDPRDVRYLEFVTKRLHGVSDTEIAEKWNLSPIALYRILSHDGYPVCQECGDRPEKCTHSRVAMEEKNDKELERRNPRATKKSARDKTLPPPIEAAYLFRTALKKLIQEVDRLEDRREAYTGGRFISTDVEQAAGLMVARKDVSAEVWQKLREQHGEEAFNDAGDKFWLSGVQVKQPKGGAISPVWPLPALITAYLVAGEPLSPLLKALHPEPHNADLEKLRVYIEGRKKPDGRDGIEVLSRQVAALIRGDLPKRGTPPPAMSSLEHNVACSTTDYRQQGLSDAEIAKKFAHKGITERDVKRLGSFGLSWPND